MKKILILFTILIAFLPVCPVNASEKIDAKAAIMVDASTGQIIYEQNGNKQLPVASVSKLLTVAVIHDELQKHIITDTTKVTITPEISAIANDPTYSNIGLVSGESYPVIELLNAAIVKSADGATLALSTANGTSPDEFVIQMNKKAHDLGLRHTKIINPTGLTNAELKSFRSDNVPDNAENEMSAQDIAILTRYLIHSYPSLLQVSAQKKANFLITKGNVKSIANLNKMLPGEQYTVPGVTINGLKTGTSKNAGACFVSTGTYKHHQIITVVLHANGSNPDNRFIQTQKLYKMLQHNYHLQQVHVPKQVLTTKISGGNKATITISPRVITVWSNTKLNSYTISQNFDNKLTNQTQMLQAPIKKGEKIGQLTLTNPNLKTLSDEPLTYHLYSNDTITKGNFLERLFN